MKNPVKAWSLSALQLYEKCPRSYKAAKIDKITSTKKSPAMERGIAVHAKGEQFLKGNIPSVPKEYASFRKEMLNLRKHGAESEKKVGITKDWRITGFFDKDVWLRFVTDAEVDLVDRVLLVVDFKTGRIYDSNEDQSQLYACAYMHDGYDLVNAEFWYLDQDDSRSYDYRASQKNILREYWEDRVTPLFSDTKFETTPSNNACRWCVIKSTCPDAEG
jgi:hypothetical protein